MKKILTVFLAAAFLFLASCSGQPVKENVTTPTTASSIAEALNFNSDLGINVVKKTNGGCTYYMPTLPVDEENKKLEARINKVIEILNIIDADLDYSLIENTLTFKFICSDKKGDKQTVYVPYSISEKKLISLDSLHATEDLYKGDIASCIKAVTSSESLDDETIASFLDESKEPLSFTITESSYNIYTLGKASVECVVIPFDIFNTKKPTPTTTNISTADNGDTGTKYSYTAPQGYTPASGDKVVALTFDDGPSATWTPKLLAKLAESGSKATFFMQGYRVVAAKDVVKMVADAGCEIGNHSWDHPNFNTLSFAQINSQIDKTQNAIKDIIGYYPKLIRPPYGNVKETVAGKLDLFIIKWSVDTLDWKTKNAEAVLNEVKKSVRNGSIILIHDIYESSYEGACLVIDYLLSEGYKLVTVSELFDLQNATVSGQSYYSLTTIK